MSITKQTIILCIGHLPSHIHGKVDILRAAGFERAVPIVLSETTVDAVKALISTCPPGTLFLAGGAMDKVYPEATAELYAYISEYAPAMLVHKVSFADFPAGTVAPVSAEIVAQAAVAVALKMLS